MKISDFEYNDILMYFQSGYVPVQYRGSVQMAQVRHPEPGWDEDESDDPDVPDGHLCVYVRSMDEQLTIPINDIMWEGNLPNRLIVSNFDGHRTLMFLGPRGYRTVCKAFGHRTLAGIMYVPGRRHPMEVNESSSMSVCREDIYSYINPAPFPSSDEAALELLAMQNAVVLSGQVGILANYSDDVDVQELGSYRVFNTCLEVGHGFDKPELALAAARGVIR